MKPLIAVTMGDMNGIGPEVALKAVTSDAIRVACHPVLIGRREIFEYYAHLVTPPPRFSDYDGPEHSIAAGQGGGCLPVAAIPGRSIPPSPGRISRQAGKSASQAIAVAVQMALVGDVQAIVTAPVSKRAMHMAGITYPGQTELLKDMTESASVAMMLVSPTLRVGLATIHVPVSGISKALTRALLRERIVTIHTALHKDWRIQSPKLAVLGLNPHAGEGGDIGTEERRVIVPALEDLRKKGIHAEGPFPADAFFARLQPGAYDAVVAMYHDQGLIPLKMTANGHGVNYTAGLRIVRTSPDHGTAFPIAGKGIADPGSMVEAILLAAELARNRGRA